MKVRLEAILRNAALYMQTHAPAPVSSIVFPRIVASHFELKTNFLHLLQVNQFVALPHQDVISPRFVCFRVVF